MNGLYRSNTDVEDSLHYQKEDKMEYKVIKQMDCPICDKIHDVEERKRMTTATIKGEEVEYLEKYYYGSIPIPVDITNCS